jgi:predicted amidophosphoribosyltransferase
MKKLCIACFRWKGSKIPKICEECLNKFAPGIQDEYGVSLFHYQTILRDLIWRGKIRGDLPAISLLASLFLAADEATELADWCEVIIPAPSSLWGRIRGKFDIAFHMAAKLAKETAKPIENAPGSLFWRLRKRSQHHHESPDDFARNPPNLTGHRRILIIDDVMTTGQTLHEIAAFYPDDTTKFLTLASATPG